VVADGRCVWTLLYLHLDRILPHHTLHLHLWALAVTPYTHEPRGSLKLHPGAMGESHPTILHPGALNELTSSDTNDPWRVAGFTGP